MRTTKFGHIKGVRGVDRRTKKWVQQNILIPKKQAEPRGRGLLIKNQKLKQQIKNKGIRLSSIRKMKSGGKMDYTIR